MNTQYDEPFFEQEENRNTDRLKKQIFTIEWDLMQIKDKEMKKAKIRQLHDLKQRLTMMNNIWR